LKRKILMVRDYAKFLNFPEFFPLTFIYIYIYIYISLLLAKKMVVVTISLSQCHQLITSFQSLTFFIFEMIFIRLPMTGAVTMLICKIPMNFLITFVYVLFYYLNYAMIYSTLAISLLRVTAVLRPIDSSKVCSGIISVLISTSYSFYNVHYCSLGANESVVYNMVPNTCDGVLHTYSRFSTRIRICYRLPRGKLLSSSRLYETTK
uniref:Product n=1 Tax=Haemonchus placei TaxID=6290 RepID=A0A0N4X529_HAEPC